MGRPKEREKARREGYCISCLCSTSIPINGKVICEMCIIRHRDRRIRLREMGLCSRCGRPSSKYRCPACYSKTAQGPSYRRRVDTSKCVVCGFTTVVDVHHKDGDKSNNQDCNLIALCPNCHAMVHRGLLCCL